MKTNVVKLFIFTVCLLIAGASRAQFVKEEMEVLNLITGEKTKKMVDTDEIASKAFFKKQLATAKSGDVEAQMTLALHFLALADKGEATAGEKAITWLEAAAKRKNTIAMRRLYYCYLQGQGVEKSKEKAVSYLLQAAALDDIAALGDLAIHYCEVEKNDEEALKWLRESATKGAKIASSSTTKLENRIEAASIAHDGFGNAAAVYRSKKNGASESAEREKIEAQAKKMEEQAQKMRKLLDKLNEESTLKEMTPAERRAYQAEKKQKAKEAAQKKHENTKKEREAEKEKTKKKNEKKKSDKNDSKTKSSSKTTTKK